MSRRNRKITELKAYRFDPICEGKRFFKTEEEALEAADTGMLDDMSVSLGVYRCVTCRQWHLTSITAVDYPLR